MFAISGVNSLAGSSKETSPSSTNCISAVPTNALVQEARSITESVVMRLASPSSRTPAAPS